MSVLTPKIKALFWEVLWVVTMLFIWSSFGVIAVVFAFLAWALYLILKPSALLLWSNRKERGI